MYSVKVAALLKFCAKSYASRELTVPIGRVKNQSVDYGGHVTSNELRITFDFGGFASQIFQENSQILPRLDYEHFRQNAFQLFIHCRPICQLCRLFPTYDAVKRATKIRA